MTPLLDSGLVMTDIREVLGHRLGTATEINDRCRRAIVHTMPRETMDWANKRSGANGTRTGAMGLKQAIKLQIQSSESFLKVRIGRIRLRGAQVVSNGNGK